MERIPTRFVDKNGNRIFMHHRLKGEILGYKGIFTIEEKGFANPLVMEGFEYLGRYKQHGFLEFEAKRLEIV